MQKIVNEIVITCSLHNEMFVYYMCNILNKYYIFSIRKISITFNIIFFIMNSSIFFLNHITKYFVFNIHVDNREN